MNKKRSGLLGAGLLVMTGIAGAAGTSLQVDFTGALVDRLCVFEQEDTPLEVTFPVRAVKFFDAYTKTDTEKFVIGLKNCTVSTQGKLVDLTFNAVQTVTVGGITMLLPEGDTGLAIALVDGKGQNVEPGEAVELGSITSHGDGSINRFSLGAYVTAQPGVAIKPGAYRATTTFTLSYR
ncbi:fimbrial protein [Salmonella enterica]|nr:fimbrial protein [Salmonella enterica]